jgi:predicted nucleic acid-binding protein
MPGEFLDTNIVVYAFGTDARAEIALELLARRCTISVQVLNEFTNVARRKLAMTWDEVKDALDAIQTSCRAVLPLDVEMQAEAVAIASRYNLGIFDASIIAASLRAQCSLLWSEDMQDGMTIDGRLRICNPFRT